MLSVVYQHTPVIALAKWLDYVVALIRCMFRRLLIAQAFMQKWFFFFPQFMNRVLIVCICGGLLIIFIFHTLIFQIFWDY
jgi:hypothetical protein